ncbi:MAG: hypothetical protein IH856_13065 [Deltaproteobacteria bacterium]|nr:hypothetical protein [Deltaproteobacteria bacterium]
MKRGAPQGGTFAMDETRKIKSEVIARFFGDVDTRVAFLSELARTGHKREAMTLCLTYIDSFAQWLCWPATSSGRNFVEAVMQFGGDPLMPLAHPLQAIRAFETMKAPWKDLANRIKDAFPGPSYELLTTPAFVGALRSRLTNIELEKLRPEVWRTTIANLTYQHLRNPSVHAFGGSDGIWLSQTTHQGAPVPPIEFQQLLGCVRGLVAEARRRSEETGQWFGNDAMVKDA